MKNQNQTGLKIFKPKINLNHNKSILVPRDHDPSGLRQESRPLAASNTGSVVKSNKTDWLKTTERVLCACSGNGSGQRSQFLVQTRRITASRDENVRNHLKVIPLNCIAHPRCARFFASFSARKSARAHNIKAFPSD